MNKNKRKRFLLILEGPRKDTTIEKLSKLRPVFSKNGTVTAGNSSQTSDGAAFCFINVRKNGKKTKCKSNC